MIHLIIGRQGSGKTLFIVKMALKYSQMGKTVYSNVHLNFPYIPLKYDDIIQCNLKDGIVIIDEIHLLLPSRNSMSKRSRLICDGFLSMVRKKGLEVYGTTQTLRKVDIRFREEKDYLYIAKKYALLPQQASAPVTNTVSDKDNNNSTLSVTGAMPDYTYNWVEIKHNHSLSKDILIAIHLTVIEMFSLDETSFMFKGNAYYDLYDSCQIIKVQEDDT